MTNRRNKLTRKVAISLVETVQHKVRSQHICTASVLWKELGDLIISSGLKICNLAKNFSETLN